MNGLGTQKIVFCDSLLVAEVEAVPAVTCFLVCSGSCVYGSLSPPPHFFYLRQLDVNPAKAGPKPG